MNIPCYSLFLSMGFGTESRFSAVAQGFLAHSERAGFLKSLIKSLIAGNCVLA